jgi:hypothetical protein
MKKWLVAFSVAFAGVSLIASPGLAGASQVRVSGARRPPRGYSTVRIAKAGMTLVVPERWVKADLTRRPIDGFIRQFKKSDPKGAALVASRHDFLAKSGLFAAFDPSAKPYSDFVTVAATASGSPFIPTGRPDDIAALYAQNLGLANSQVADGTLAGAPAATITSTTQALAGKGRSTTLHNTGYVVATKDGALQIDFAGRKDATKDKNLQTMVASVSLDQVTVPTQGTVSGTINGSEIRGSGSGTPFGDTSVTTTIQPFGQPPSCGPGPGTPVRGSINTQTANSDILNQAFSGTVCQSGSHISGDLILFEFDTTATTTVTGGTGCFTDATGSGTLTAHSSANDPNSASLDSTATGTITLKKRPNCPYFQG